MNAQSLKLTIGRRLNVLLPDFFTGNEPDGLTNTS